MRLPLLAERSAALETCSLCPKLCRAACPVSEADGREATTPWGKMTSAHLLDREGIERTAEQAATAWACTGCFGCRDHCDLKNDVAGTLLDARAATMLEGLAPPAARAVVDRHGERLAKTHRGLRDAVDRARARGAEAVLATETEPSLDATATHLLVGCLAAREGFDAKTGDDLAADAIVAASSLRDDRRKPLVVVSGCCGAPLRMAGDRQGFAHQSQRLASRLAGVRRLVVSDAGCALTMRVRYGEVGTRLPEQLEVVHLVELAARALPDVPRLDAPFLRRIRNGGVRYHDACALGRGLGVYAAPRALLTRLLGAAPHEFARHGVEARCAGGGGILPSTDRPTADAIAAARVDEHLDEGGGAIATTCASSRKSLARGGRARVFDVTTLLARAFERGER